ncbi:MAG: tetratricopeptide repeat protein [Myxococcales bacterium]|nr:tetratricopeptide repeat protein [Myxococcales bacterium]
MNDSLQNQRQRFDSDPNDLESFRALRDAYAQAERWNDLATVFEARASSMAAGLESTHLYLLAGEVREQREQNDSAALRNFEAVLEQDAKNQTAIEALLRLYTKLERHDDYLRVVGLRLQIAATKQEQAHLYAHVGELYQRKLGDSAKAALYFKKAFQTYPAETRYLAAGRLAYRDLERWDMVVRLIDVELKLRIPAWRMRELLWLKAAILDEKVLDSDAADDAFGELMTHWEEDARMSEKPEAADDWASLGLLRPSSPQERRILAYREGKKWRKLIEALRHEVRLTHNLEHKAETFLEIGRVELNELNDPESARVDVERALTINPFSRDALLAMEQIYRKIEDWAGLDQVLLKRVLQSEGHETVELYHELLTNYRHRLDKPKQAVEVAKRLIDLAADDALTAKGIAYFENDPAEYRELLRMLREKHLLARRWRPLLDIHESLIRLTKGDELRSLLLESAEVAREHLGDDNAAFAYYRQASDLSPEDDSLYAFLEEIAVDTSLQDELLALYEKRLTQLDERSSQRLVLRQRLAALAARGDDSPGRAFDAFLQLQALNPSDLKTLTSLEELARKADDPTLWEQLAGAYDAAMAVSSVDSVRHDLLCKKADVLLKQLARGTDALESLFEASNLSPSDTQLLEAIERLAVDEQRMDEYVRFRRERWDQLEKVADQIHEAHEIARFIEEHQLNWEVAFEFYLMAFQIDPFHSESERLVLDMCERQRDWELYSKVLELKIRDFENEDDKVLLILKLADLAENKLRDLSLARRQYERALRNAPQHRGAFEALKRVASKTGDWNKLVEFLELFLEQLTSPEQIKSLLLELGTIATTQLNDAGRASQSYQKLLELDPYHREAVERLRECYRVLGDKENLAALLLGQLGRPSPQGRLDQLLDAAQLKSELGQPDEAATLFRQAQGLDPNNLVALDWLIDFHRKRGHYRELRELLEQRKSLVHPDDALPIVWELCFLYETLLGLPDKTWLTLKHLHESRPDNLEILMSMEAFLRRHQRHDDLLQLYLQKEALWLSLADRTRLIVFDIASLLHRNFGDFSKAIQYYQRTLELDHNHLLALLGLFDCYSSLQQWSKSVDVIDRLRELITNPFERASLITLKATILEAKLFRFDQARRTYEELLLIDPRHPLALRRLAHLARKTANWEVWVSHTSQLLKSGLDVEERIELLWELAAVCEKELRDPTSTQQALRQLLEIDPDHRGAQDRLLGMGVVDENVETNIDLHIRKAKSTEGAERARHYYEAACLTLDHLRDKDAAVRLYEAAVTAHPDHFASLAPLAELKFALNEWDRAEAYLMRFFSVLGAPQNADEAQQISAERLASLFVTFGTIAQARGDFKRSMTAYRAALDYRRAPETYLRIIDVAFSLQDLEMAIETYRELESSEPEGIDSRLTLRVVDAMQKCGRVEQSDALLEVLADDEVVGTDALNRLAERARAASQPLRALGYLDRLLLRADDQSDRYDLLLESATLHEASGGLERAYESLQKAIALKPSIELYLELLRVAERLSRGTDVSQILKAIEREEASSEQLAQAYATAGEISHRNGLGDKALRYYRKALSHEPHLERAFKGVEHVHLAIDRPDRLLEFYEEVLAHPGTIPDTREAEIRKKALRLKEEARGFGDESLARDYQRALEIAPNDRELRLAHLKFVRETAGAGAERETWVDFVCRFPSDAAGYHSLWRCAQEIADSDLSFRISSLLFFLKEANATQESFYLTNRRSVARLSEPLAPQDYQSLLRMQTRYAFIYPLLTIANAEAGDLFRIRPEERKLTSIRRADDVESDRMGTMFRRLRQLFGVTSGALYLSPGQDATEVWGNATPPYCIVNEDFLTSLLEPQQLFLLAREIVILRDENILAMSFPGIELTSLIDALLSLLHTRKPPPPPVSKLARSWREALQTVFSKSALTVMRKQFKRADAGDLDVDPTDVAKLVHNDVLHTANRAGLLAMGDIVLAFKLLLRLEGEDISYVQSAQAFGELIERYPSAREMLRYYLSSEYGELRVKQRLAVRV